MLFYVKTRYGDYRIESDAGVEGNRFPKLFPENQVALFRTPGGIVSVYGWIMVYPVDAEQYVTPIQEEEEPVRRMVDYRQVSPDDAAQLVAEGYEYTGEKWRGLVGVAKYEETEEASSH